MATKPFLLTLTLAVLLAPLLVAGSSLHFKPPSPFSARTLTSNSAPPPPPPPPPPPSPPRSPSHNHPSPHSSSPLHPRNSPPPPTPRLAPALPPSPSNQPNSSHQHSPPPALSPPRPPPATPSSFTNVPRAPLQPNMVSTLQKPAQRKDTNASVDRTVGWAFLGAGIFLQVALGAFLIYKKRQLQRIDQASDGIPTSSSSPALLST